MAGQRITRGQWHAVTAGFLGWMLDAFDFFMLGAVTLLGSEQKGKAFVHAPVD